LALNTGEKLGMQGLLAQSHFQMARARTFRRRRGSETTLQASQIAASIQEGAHTDTIAKRSNLNTIFAHPS
jgi:hypothetical protein